MLNLYKAGYFSTHGEDILDEAIVFATGHLKSRMAHLDHPPTTQVGHALELPLRKRIQRLEARYYISVYSDDVERSNVLLELAKLDFNVVQSLHRREIKDISRCWLTDQLQHRCWLTEWLEVQSFNSLIGCPRDLFVPLGNPKQILSRELSQKNPREGSNGMVGPSQEAMWLRSISTEKAPRVENANCVLPSIDWDRVGGQTSVPESQLNVDKRT